MRITNVTDQILSSVGLQRATTDWLPKTLFGFGLGLVAGACAALMVAPKPGSEMREDLVDGANKLVTKGKEQLVRGKEQLQQQIDSLKVRMNNRNLIDAEPPLGV